jgi:hypothetical protein
MYDAGNVKIIELKQVALMDQLKNEGLIRDYRGTGSLHEMLLFNEYDPLLLDKVGITTNQIHRATLGVVSPFIADDEYWYELEKRVRLLLAG